MVSPDSALWASPGVKRPTEGTKANEEVLDDEAPGEQPMIAPTWFRRIAPSAGADRAPERDPGERAEEQQGELAAVQGERDAARLEDERSRSRSRAPSPTMPNASPASMLATSFAPITRERRGVKRNVGRIVPKRYSLVTSRTPGERGEDSGEAADAEHGRAGPPSVRRSVPW